MIARSRMEAAYINSGADSRLACVANSHITIPRLNTSALGVHKPCMRISGAILQKHMSSARSENLLRAQE